MKHLLKLQDLTADELTGILNLADQLKYEKKQEGLWKNVRKLKKFVHFVIIMSLMIFWKFTT